MWFENNIIAHRRHLGYISPNCKACINGTIQVILSPEDCKYCVAHELVNKSTLLNDLFHHYIKVAVQQLYNHIRGLILADRREATDVNKCNRCLHCLIL